jgi:hypothetical protein
MPLAMVCCVAKESFELMLRAERLRLEAPQRVMVWWLHIMVGWLTRKGEERDKFVESMGHLCRSRIVQKRKKDQSNRRGLEVMGEMSRPRMQKEFLSQRGYGSTSRTRMTSGKV